MQANVPSKELQGESMVQGKYRLSIPTSLALETLFGINDNIAPTDPLPYTRYKHLVINVRTLLRNIYGSVNKELKVKWTTDHYLETLLEELRDLPMIVDNQSSNQIGVYYYLGGYYSVEKYLPNAQVKTPKPNSNNVYDQLEKEIIVKLLRMVKAGELNIMLTDCTVPLDLTKGNRTAIMTHLPIDLVEHARTNYVDLLESHTGVIKDSSMWYTKLNSKPDRVPFSKFALKAFGDGKTVLGLPPKYRTYLNEFAKAKKWNQSTSDFTMKLMLPKMPDKDKLADYLKLL